MAQTAKQKAAFQKMLAANKARKAKKVKKPKH